MTPFEEARDKAPIKEAWQGSGGESGTRLENFMGGFKAGADWALEYLTKQAPEFDEKMTKEYWMEHQRCSYSTHDQEDSRSDDNVDGARWQFDQMKALLAARDKQIARLKAEAIAHLQLIDGQRDLLAEREAEVARLKKELHATPGWLENAERVKKLEAQLAERDALKAEVARLKEDVETWLCRAEINGKRAFEIQVQLAERDALVKELAGALKKLEQEPTHKEDVFKVNRIARTALAKVPEELK